MTSQRHLNLHGPRSPAVRIESFRPAGDHTHTHTHTHGPLTCKLVIGSVQLSGVRQALVTVFRLHFFFFARVRRNVELWHTADMFAILFVKIYVCILNYYYSLFALTEDGYKCVGANKS